MSHAIRGRLGTVLIVLLTVSFGGYTASGAGSLQLAQDLCNIGTILMSLAAGIACLVRARQARNGMRRPWTAIGLGSLCYACGEATWTWMETVRGQEIPFPALPDIGYLGMVPLMAAGLMMVPVARQSIANRVRSVADGLVIATSLLLVSWIFVIRPLLTEGSDSVLGLFVLLAYPVTDVVLVTIVLYTLATLRRGGHDSGPLGLVGAAVVLLGVTDSVYAFVTLEDSYTSGTVLDVGWFASFALILLAARRPDRAPIETPGDGTADEQPIASLMPYAAVILALVVSVVWYSRNGGGDAFTQWSRSLLILLIVGRQLLTLLENRHLTRHLEDRVATRSAELQASEQRFEALVQQSSDSVALISADSGMPVGRLCLEMTESVLLTDTDENLTQLLRLKALGVTLAMDDFGTGYSSLAYLRRYPMDVLKIDRSFVDRLGGDAEDAALVHTIVRLGRTLGMRTVAEGIENAVQLSALREMGCDLAQGYYLSRPLPAAEAGRVLEAGLPVLAPVSV